MEYKCPECQESYFTTPLSDERVEYKVCTQCLIGSKGMSIDLKNKLYYYINVEGGE